MVLNMKEGAKSSTNQMQRLRMLKENRALQKDSLYFGIPSNNETKEHAEKEHGVDSWRFKTVAFIHSELVQKLLMGLLLLDVILLFIELFLLASYPHCTVVERDAIACCPIDSTNHTEEAHVDRWLSTDEHHSICEASYESFGEAACDEHKWSAVHVAENVIFSFTIAILSLFLIELNVMVVALGPRSFFCQFFFAMDYVIVTVSLVLEVVFYSLRDDVYRSFAGLLVLVRIWRFVRIGHGIVEVTHELAQEEYHKLEHYKDELAVLLRDNHIPVPEFEGSSTRNELLLAVEHHHNSRHNSRHAEREESGKTDADANAASNA